MDETSFNEILVAMTIEIINFLFAVLPSMHKDLPFTLMMDNKTV